MPYYCTVPRCTSMAGKTKDVSFHQFPRDEDLANVWNNILKRGKPYTKYSKVCSLHFTSEDYTTIGGQRNKGQGRSLKKNAIPSRNLPTDSPQLIRNSDSSFVPHSAIADPGMQQQTFHAMFLQTMLAMHAGNVTANNNENSTPEEAKPNITEANSDSAQQNQAIWRLMSSEKQTFKCEMCSKCFKDPDVFLLHQRCHTKKENFDAKEMLKANPILANLLKSGKPQTSIQELDSVNCIENELNCNENQ